MSLSSTGAGLTETIGVPPGGTTGQVATKASNQDYDIIWAAGGGGGAGVSSLNTQTGVVTLTSNGGTITITTPVSGGVNIESLAGSGVPQAFYSVIS